MGWFYAVLGVIAVVGGLILGDKRLKLEEERNQIEKERQELVREDDFNKAIALLDTYKSDFDNIKDVVIPKLESEIRATEMDISLWDQRYAQETGEIQAKIDTVDDLIGNWQMSYDAQTKSAKEQGKNTFSQLLANWSDAEVMAADRGMGGSMSLVAEQQKQRAIAYAGDDLSLGGTDGIFGASYASLLAGLASERSQYDTQKSLLSGSLSLTQTTLENELSVWEENLGIQTKALGTNLQSLYGRDGLLDKMELQLDEIITKHGSLGKDKSSSVDRARRILDEYRQLR